MKKAFTMIELIFVIVIIGILAAVAVPKMAATRNDARVAAIASFTASAANEIAARAISTGEPTVDLPSMSNIVKGMIARGDATFNLHTLNIKMNTVSDCLKLIVLSSSNDMNLTMRYGNAGSDTVCQALQSVINAADYPIPLKGTLITQ